MTHRRGRALGGERLRAHIPHPRRYQTSTLVSAIRRRGPGAPWLFEGPMNGEMFWAWVQQGWVPGLEAGDRVIMDNLAPQKIRAVRAALQAIGAWTCRRIRPISIPSCPWGARSNKSCAATPRRAAPGGGPNRLSIDSRCRRQGLFFLASNTLYNKWKCSSFKRNIAATTEYIFPLVDRFSFQERVRLLRLISTRSAAGDRDAYRAMVPRNEEFSSSVEPLEWDAEGWEGIS